MIHLIIIFSIIFVIFALYIIYKPFVDETEDCYILWYKAGKNSRKHIKFYK